MKLSAAIQEALLCLMFFDGTPKGCKLVRSLCPPNVLDPYFRQAAEAASEYYDKYEKVAGEHTLDIFEQLKASNPTSSEIYQSIFESLQATKDGINGDYILDQASKFARRQRIALGMQKALKALQRESHDAVDEAESALHRALKSSHEVFHPGLILSNPDDALRFMEETHDAGRTGIKELDALDLGPKRGGLHYYVALPNSGKSWYGINLGKISILNQERVCHITLEMSEAQVAMRYLQALFSISKRKASVLSHRFDVDELGRFVGLDEREIKDRPSFQDPNIRKFLLPKIEKLKNRAPIVIKQFPPGTLTCKMLNEYLDALEGSLSFIPDLLVVDYADEMAVDTGNYRHSLNAIIKGLRAIGIERNIRVVTMSQASKEAERAKWVRKFHVSEDWRKIAVADEIVTYSQTAAEYQLGLARILVDKARSDVKSFAVLISQAYALGQFSLESAKMMGAYWSVMKEAAPETVDDDDALGGDDDS